MSSARQQQFNKSFQSIITRLRTELRNLLALTDATSGQLKDIDLTKSSDPQTFAKVLWNLLISMDSKDVSIESAVPYYQFIKTFDYSSLQTNKNLVDAFLSLLMLIYKNPDVFVSKLEVNHFATIKAAKLAVGAKNFFSTRTFNDEITDRHFKIISSITTTKAQSTHDTFKHLNDAINLIVSGKLTVINALLSMQSDDKEIQGDIVNATRQCLETLNVTISKQFGLTTQPGKKTVIQEIERLKSALANELEHFNKFIQSSLQQVNPLQQVEVEVVESVLVREKIKKTHKKTTLPGLVQDIKQQYERSIQSIDQLAGQLTPELKNADLADPIEVEEPAESEQPIALEKKELEAKEVKEGELKLEPVETTLTIAQDVELQQAPVAIIREFRPLEDEVKPKTELIEKEQLEADKFVTLKKQVDEMAGEYTPLKINDELATPTTFNHFKSESEVLAAKLKAQLESVPQFDVPKIGEITSFAFKKKKSLQEASQESDAEQAAKDAESARLAEEAKLAIMCDKIDSNVLDMAAHFEDLLKVEKFHADLLELENQLEEAEKTAAEASKLLEDIVVAPVVAAPQHEVRQVPASQSIRRAASAPVPHLNEVEDHPHASRKGGIAPDLTAPKINDAPQPEPTFWQKHGSKIAFGITFGLLIAGLVVLNVLFPISILANAGLGYAAFVVATAAAVATESSLNPAPQGDNARTATVERQAVNGMNLRGIGQKLDVDSFAMVEEPKSNPIPASTSSNEGSPIVPARPAPGIDV